MAVDMFSHRIKTAVMDSMETNSLTSALHQIMQNHGWKTWQLSCDPGSSLIPATQATFNELRQLEDRDEEDDEVEAEEAAGLDPATAAAVVKDLRDGGFHLRTPRAKASWRQSNVKSSIRVFKEH